MKDSLYGIARDEVKSLSTTVTSVTKQVLTMEQATNLVEIILDKTSNEDLKWLVAAYQYDENASDLTTNQVKREIKRNLVLLSRLTSATLIRQSNLNK